MMRRALLPRIFVLGELEPACQLMEESVGFRYSMEHWLHRMLTSNEAIVVNKAEVADFVYLPHCATSVFMHMVVQDEQEHQGVFRTANSQSELRLNSSILRRKEVFLGYEGNLPASSVLRLDSSYLMHKVNTIWPSAAFDQCWRRSSCKFLVGSIYGRHVWRHFAKVFGDKAVFITHAGMSAWLRGQPDEYFLAGSESVPETIDNTCRASCRLHCMLEPPAALPQDVVLPWVVAFEWTPRATAYRQRDILVFYSGTENSCSRKKIREAFHGRFEMEMNFFDPRSHNKEKVLIFPSDFRLKQQEWSELAYRSKLCLCPDGDSPNTGRLVEVIMHGCVPLIISNRLQPPFHKYFDWSKIAFFLREDAIPRLPAILAEQFSGPSGDRRILEKRTLLRQMSHLCDYARDGIGSTLLLALREQTRDLRGES
ncbi:unnamed protein product [Durusdinium trenchii]|uniref:Exostosin GT47 domain-containing protein n=1 Tax=Durusdinium trenchii TaxID=1381693 RepID=A0ABP0RVV6_9DINO